MKVYWSPAAIERVTEAAEFIAADKPSAAARWVDRLFDAVRRLEHFPESGRVVPEVGRKDVRELLHGNFRVIYRLSAGVDILTVRRQEQILKPTDPELG